MGKPVVFVIGASGNVGVATVAALSTRYADKVEIRAGVRNPDKADRLKSLANVTVVQAAVGDKENLTGILNGVDALLVVTPPTKNRAQLSIATAEAAKVAGVKHIAVVSILTASLPNTIIGGQFAEIEGAVQQLGIPYTFLRLPYFAENFWGFKPTIVEQSVIFSPRDPEKPFQVMTVENIGEAGAAILADPAKHAGKIYNLIGDRVTPNDVVKSFSKALGRDIKFSRISFEAAKQGYIQGAGFQEWEADGTLELVKLANDSAPEVNPSDLSAYESITGGKATTVSEWIAKNTPGFQ